MPELYYSANKTVAVAVDSKQLVTKVKDAPPPVLKDPKAIDDTKAAKDAEVAKLATLKTDDTVAIDIATGVDFLAVWDGTAPYFKLLAGALPTSAKGALVIPVAGWPQIEAADYVPDPPTLPRDAADIELDKIKAKEIPPPSVDAPVLVDVAVELAP
jgi:hypothetical protein